MQLCAIFGRLKSATSKSAQLKRKKKSLALPSPPPLPVSFPYVHIAPSFLILDWQNVSEFPPSQGKTDGHVEGLYCKRPIQCLASSEILTPHPLTARRVGNPPPLVRGRTHSLGGEGVGGQ